MTSDPYAPRRQRVAIVQPNNPPEETLSRNAARVAEGIERLQESERQVRAENSDLKARVEQKEIALNQAQSEIERLKIELEAERAERIRYAAGLEHIIHAAHKLAEQPEA